MFEKTEQIKKRLEQFETVIKTQNFFGIEEVNISEIKEIEDPIELEKLIELFLKIRDLSTHSAIPFGNVQRKAVDLRTEAERHLRLIKQKALQ
jgi:hypothetical protein